jgi:hypothetical protein
MKRFAIALPLLIIPGLAFAHGGGHGASDIHAPRVEARYGGKVVVAEGDAFEVIFEDKGLHVYPMSTDGRPLLASNLSGEVRIRSRKSRGKTLPMQAVRGEDGRVIHLMLRQDFSGFKDGSRKASFTLRGLPGGERKFSTVLRRRKGMTRGAGMPGMAGSHSDHDMKGMAGSKSNHSRKGMAGSHSSSMGGASMAAQRKNYPINWCLVTGERLGADGPPVEIMHEGQLIRLCCKGCVSKFKRNSEKYLAKLKAARSGKRIQRPAGSGSAANPSDGHGGHAH